MARYRTHLCAAMLLLCGLATPAWAVTRVVDQDGLASSTNCNATTAAYLSIGAAVAAAVANDTILVCPGSGPYDEQLVIGKALTVKGFALTNVVIRPTSVVANTSSLYSGAPMAAIIVVADTTATLTNLVIDGTLATPSGSDCSVPNVVGIFYRNASGTVSDSTVRNMKLAAGLEGCQAGLGIFAQSGSGGGSDVTLTGVDVHDYQKNGIVGNEVGTLITVNNSYVRGDPASNASIQNGIQIGFGATGVLDGNRIVDQIYEPCTASGGCGSGSSYGILIFDAADDVIVTNNTITNTQGGIFVGGGIIQSGSNKSDVSQNAISGTRVFDAVFIFGDGHTIRNNTITNTDRSGVFLYGSGNTVQSNRIQEAAVGVWDYFGTGNTYPLTGNRKNVPINVEQNTMSGVSAASARATSLGKSIGPAKTTSNPTPTPVRF